MKKGKKKKEREFDCSGRSESVIIMIIIVIARVWREAPRRPRSSVHPTMLPDTATGDADDFFLLLEE